MLTQKGNQILGAIALILLSSCGYTLQKGRSTELVKDGVERIYVAPVLNNTYRSSVENVVYNALIRSLTTYKGIRLVQDPSAADAVLSTSITTAESRVNSNASAFNLNPQGAAPDRFQNIQVAYDYIAVLECNFSLLRRNPGPSQRAKIWDGGFSRSAVFNGSNQLGTLGTTSPLINDSEFERTIVDVAQGMADDVREAMLSRF